MSGLINYFRVNKNSNSNKNYRHRKNNKKIRNENEIKFNMNRQETFQDIYNINNNDENKDDYNSLIISSPYNLLLPNSKFIHKKYYSEGNNSFIDENTNYVNNNRKNGYGYNNVEIQSDNINEQYIMYTENNNNSAQLTNSKNNIYQNKNKYGNTLFHLFEDHIFS